MLAKLLGLGARVDRPTSIGVANAGEPVSLTDIQLDMVAGGFASVFLNATNASADFGFNLNDGPSGKLAQLQGNFTIAGPAPHSGAAFVEVGPNDFV
jgi:hypothetical protein